MHKEPVEETNSIFDSALALIIFCCAAAAAWMHS